MSKPRFAGPNDPQTGVIIAAAIEVHKVLGHGFLEKVYAKALALELMSQGVPVRTELPVPVFYKGDKLGCGYQADLVCFGEVLVELKAQAGLTEVDVGQVINYLKASGFTKALLLNFGTPRIQIRRVVMSVSQAHAGTDFEEICLAEDAVDRCE